MTDLLILAPDASELAAALREKAPPPLALHAATDVSAAGRWLARAEVILGVPALVAEVIDQAPQVGWVQSTFAGVDALMRPGLRRDYRLTGVKGVFGLLMSEYVFGWLLAHERGLFALDAQQRERRWEERPYRTLQGLALGVAGLGSIGRQVAATARHFGMRVVGYRRTPEPVEGVERVYAGDELAAFLAASDHVVLVLPATPETHHLIDAKALAAMRPEALLINVGRGSLVDGAALADALERGLLAGAVLDVFEQEPLPSDSPLWTARGCHVTPHIAAVSFPEEIANLFLDNLQRWRAGAPLAHEIDFARGY